MAQEQGDWEEDRRKTRQKEAALAVALCLLKRQVGIIDDRLRVPQLNLRFTLLVPFLAHLQRG